MKDFSTHGGIWHRPAIVRAANISGNYIAKMFNQVLHGDDPVLYGGLAKNPESVFFARLVSPGKVGREVLEYVEGNFWLIFSHSVEVKQ